MEPGREMRKRENDWGGREGRKAEDKDCSVMRES